MVLGGVDTCLAVIVCSFEGGGGSPKMPPTLLAGYLVDREFAIAMARATYDDLVAFGRNACSRAAGGDRRLRVRKVAFFRRRESPSLVSRWGSLTLKQPFCMSVFRLGPEEWSRKGLRLGLRVYFSVRFTSFFEPDPSARVPGPSFFLETGPNRQN